MVHKIILALVSSFIILFFSGSFLYNLNDSEEKIKDLEKEEIITKMHDEQMFEYENLNAKVNEFMNNTTKEFINLNIKLNQIDEKIITNSTLNSSKSYDDSKSE